MLHTLHTRTKMPPPNGRASAAPILDSLTFDTQPSDTLLIIQVEAILIVQPRCTCGAALGTCGRQRTASGSTAPPSFGSVYPRARPALSRFGGPARRRVASSAAARAPREALRHLLSATPPAPAPIVQLLPLLLLPHFFCPSSLDRAVAAHTCSHPVMPPSASPLQQPHRSPLASHGPPQHHHPIA